MEIYLVLSGLYLWIFGMLGIVTNTVVLVVFCVQKKPMKIPLILIGFSIVLFSLGFSLFHLYSGYFWGKIGLFCLLTTRFISIAFGLFGLITAAIVSIIFYFQKKHLNIPLIIFGLSIVLLIFGLSVYNTYSVLFWGMIGLFGFLGLLYSFIFIIVSSIQKKDLKFPLIMLVSFIVIFSHYTSLVSVSSGFNMSPGSYLGLIGIFGFIVIAVISIISGVQKQPMKILLILLGSFILLIGIGYSLDNPSPGSFLEVVGMLGLITTSVASIILGIQKKPLKTPFIFLSTCFSLFITAYLLEFPSSGPFFKIAATALIGTIAFIVTLIVFRTQRKSLKIPFLILSSCIIIFVFGSYITEPSSISSTSQTNTQVISVESSSKKAATEIRRKQTDYVNYLNNPIVSNHLINMYHGVYFVKDYNLFNEEDMLSKENIANFQNKLGVIQASYNDFLTVTVDPASSAYPLHQQLLKISKSYEFSYNQMLSSLENHSLMGFSSNFNSFSITGSELFFLMIPVLLNDAVHEYLL